MAQQVPTISSTTSPDITEEEFLRQLNLCDPASCTVTTYDDTPPATPPPPADPVSSSSSSEVSAPDVLNFTSEEEMHQIADFYQDLNGYGPVVRINLEFWTPRYTTPAMRLCRTCVQECCVNYVCYHVTDYIFPDYVSESYRDGYFCEWCHLKMYTLYSMF